MDHAYGGIDRHAGELIHGPRGRALGAPRGMDAAPFNHVLYPRNGAGRGYFLDVHRERLEGAPLPTLEDPTDPVTPERILSERQTQWIDRPVAACYAPIDLFTFPRSAFGLRPVYDTPECTISTSCPPARCSRRSSRVRSSMRGPRNPRVYNAAPSGLAVCRLRGGERARLWNVHRERAFLEFDLPDDEPASRSTCPASASASSRPC